MCNLEEYQTETVDVVFFPGCAYTRWLVLQAELALALWVRDAATVSVNGRDYSKPERMGRSNRFFPPHRQKITFPHWIPLRSQFAVCGLNSEVASFNERDTRWDRDGLY